MEQKCKWYRQLNGHEPKSYETIGRVAGRLFKHVKDRINSLNLKNRNNKFKKNCKIIRKKNLPDVTTRYSSWSDFSRSAKKEKLI